MSAAVFHCDAPPAALTPAAARALLLNDAADCVCRDRAATYGEAEDSFAAIAAIWDVLDGQRGSRPRGPQDVALAMIALKAVRAAANPQHRDSWVDLAGYAACGGGMIPAPEPAP